MRVLFIYSVNHKDVLLYFGLRRLCFWTDFTPCVREEQGRIWRYIIYNLALTLSLRYVIRLRTA